MTSDTIYDFDKKQYDNMTKKFEVFNIVVIIRHCDYMNCNSNNNNNYTPIKLTNIFKLFYGEAMRMHSIDVGENHK